MKALESRKSVSLTLVIISLISITVAISPFPGFDVYNEIKLFLLTMLAFPLMYHVVKLNLNKHFFHLNRTSIFLIFCLLLSLLIPIIFSSSLLSQQFWGVLGRNNGLLTFFGLATIFLYFSSVQDISVPLIVSNAVILVSIFIQFFSILEISGLLFGIEKSVTVLGPLTTFGNPNFTSAFLGFSTCIVFFRLLDKKLLFFYRCFLALIIATNIIIFFLSGSVQGLISSTLGIFFVLIVHRKWTKLLVKKSLIFMVFFITLIFSVIRISGINPFEILKNDNSLIYRFDYWQAGLSMFLNNPLTGVGLNSYGDWYRQSRSLSAATRGDVNRFSDSAHNTFIDLAANAGILAVFFILLITVFIFYRIFSRLTKSKISVPNSLLGISAAWIAWFIQNLISMEQIGVAIWGWTFAGILMNSGSYQDQKNLTNFSKEKIRLRPSQSKSLLFIVLLSIAGGFLGSVPLRSDWKVYNAIQKNSSIEILKSLDSVGVTAFHFRYASYVAINRIQDNQLIISINDRHLSKFPRDFSGLVIKYYRADLTSSEKAKILSTLKQNDPFNSSIK